MVANGILLKETAKIRKIAFVGDHLPRKCGIATFTTDLLSAVQSAYPQSQCLCVSVNDIEDGYDYPEVVRFEIEEQDLPSYLRAADFLNISDVDIVCLQHEFGIFGGPAGGHILAMLRELKMPVVTTLHTILREPKPDQRRAIEELIALSTRLVVMADRGRQMLHEIYGAPLSKIDLIPHGIPDVGFVDPTYFKDQFQVEGRTVLLTFGLLSPNKGIEYVLNALPAVLAEFPDVVYIVLGATHPNELRRSWRGLPAEPGDSGHPEQAGKARYLLQPVRGPGEPEGVHGRRGSIHHALPECGADHFRARSHLPSVQARRWFRHRTGTRRICWRTTGARWCRLPIRRRWPTRFSACCATTRGGMPCARMPTGWGGR